MSLASRPHGVRDQVRDQNQPKMNQSTHAQPTQTAQTLLSRGICGRLSHWLWPTGWGASSCEQTPIGTSLPPRQPYDDCKACREWQVECDHAKPQCSHCCQEQLLCFYVDPTKPKPKPKPKIKPKSNPNVPILRPIVLPSNKQNKPPPKLATIDEYDHSITPV